MESGAVLKQRIWIMVLCGMLLVSANFVFSDPMEKWESWILEDYQQHDCPWIMTKGNGKACIWPGKLALIANNQGAVFTYFIDVYEKSALVALPGTTEHWPTDVMINGKTAPVIERSMRPYIRVSSGRHKISGNFSWRKLPNILTLPSDVAIVSLQIDGKDRIIDRRNEQLIFSSKSNDRQKKADDSLSLEVFRLLTDGVPVTMRTHITLSVSGKAREVTVGSVMLDGSEMLHIQSPIPARIEADGSMRVQVSPGEHRIQVLSRFGELPQTITTRKRTKEWPEAEYISFKSAPAIRQAKLSGPVSIDTSQISIPGEWVQYPTYRMGDGETLTIETESRGDHSPGANELYVKRDLWLDFDGRGITTLDRISGEMNKGWRLNAAVETTIGRATVDGEPVLITQDESLEGIEVRSPSIELEAVARIESTSGFSVSGWNARADQYHSTLHLPPGWRVLHASGVDDVWDTWLSKWDLWDVFLVLIIISVTRKLMNNTIAALAGVTFLVALHEPGAPLLIIPLLLLIIALLPVVTGKIKVMLRSVGVVLGVVLALSVITFAVSTFRLAIYPSLERAVIGTYSQSGYNMAASQTVLSSPLELSDQLAEQGKVSRTRDTALEEVVVTAQKRKKNLYQITENDRVQTGPGLPTWTWNAVNFRSSGPVSADQKLSIYYSTPLVTSIWRVISVFLVALYAGIVIIRLVRLSQFKTEDDANADGTTGISTTDISTTALSLGFSLILGSGLFSSPDTLAEEFPPKYLLDKLEKRLTKVPECLPNCASLNDGRIIVSGSHISIQFNAYVDTDVALPLPRSHGSWVLEHVSENDQLLPLRKQNDFFVRLPKGHHKIKIKGTITTDQAAISFPLAVHNMQVSAPDWIVEGLVDGRVRSGTLTLRAVDQEAASKTDTLKADPAPPFVRVQRHFTFGKKWNVETTVQRIAPQQGAISLPVKLVPNEKLLKDMGVIKSGEITVQLGHSQKYLSWLSTIEPTEQLRLKASSGNTYLEEWSFTPSSLWRLTYEGIPPVKPDTDTHAFEPVFKPWPDEMLVVDIRKPGGVPGDTHTVENALLTVNAGSKLQRSTLTMEIRSSLGSDYTVILPEGAEILNFSMDSLAMNTPSENEIKIPLQPGSQLIAVEFQMLTDMGFISRSPKVQLQDGATNIRVQYSLPRDRWPLYLSGPPIGPAMLYWGVLCVIVLGALLLPRLVGALGFKMPIAIAGWLLLGLGLSTVNSYGVLIIAIMFFVLAARNQLIKPDTMTRFKFNTMQCLIVGWVGLAVLCMVAAIPMGLLSNPEMSVVGNGSSSHFYNYYQDIVGEPGGFPTITVISVPMLAYRAVMLLWSLWLSTQIIRWAGWAWGCFTEKETWRPKTDI